MKKITVLFSCETSSMSHWFRSNHKGRVEDYTVKFVLFSSFRVRKEVDFPYGYGSKCLWQYLLLLLYFSLSFSFPHGSKIFPPWEEDFKVFYMWLRISTFRVNLVFEGYSQWRAFFGVLSRNTMLRSMEDQKAALLWNRLFQNRTETMCRFQRYLKRNRGTHCILTHLGFKVSEMEKEG